MKVLKIIGAAFITVCVVLSLAVNVFTFLKTEKFSSDIAEIKQSMFVAEDVAMEDDVTIAGEYVIRSTLDISDAYKNGDKSSLNDKQKETLDMASKVLDEIIDSEMSDYEKELSVYQWMTQNLQYDEGALLVIPNTSADCDNPYGVLKYHNAVCVGYATTFRLFMQMMDIECKVVHDSYLGHSWDLVKLGDCWYHTDIFSDAGSSDYTNFNMNDTLCANSHEWNTDFFPAATGLEYNYAYQNKTTVKDLYSLPELVKGLIDELDASSAVAIEFEKAITDEDAAAAQYMLSQLEESVSYYSEYISLSSNWIDDNGNYVLFIYLYNYDEDDDIDVDADIMVKIDEAITNAFGEIDYDDWDWDWDDED